MWDPGIITFVIILILFFLFFNIYLFTSHNKEIVIVQHSTSPILTAEYASCYDYVLCDESQVKYNGYTYYVWLYGNNIPAISLRDIIPLVEQADAFLVVENYNIWLKAQRYNLNYNLVSTSSIYHNFDPHYVIFPAGALYLTTNLSYPLTDKYFTAIKEYYPPKHSIIWGKNIIPKTIHQTSDSLLVSRTIKHSVCSWTITYPTYHYYHHTAYDRYKFNNNNNWVYHYLYKYGGIYADIHMIAIKSLDGIFANHDLVLAIDNEKNITNTFIACRKKHPFLNYILQHIDIPLADLFIQYFNTITIGSHITNKGSYYLLQYNDNRIYHNNITYMHTKLLYDIAI